MARKTRRGEPLPERETDARCGRLGNRGRLGRAFKRLCRRLGSTLVTGRWAGLKRQVHAPGALVLSLRGLHRAATLYCRRWGHVSVLDSKSLNNVGLQRPGDLSRAANRLLRRRGLSELGGVDVRLRRGVRRGVVQVGVVVVVAVVVAFSSCLSPCHSCICSCRWLRFLVGVVEK